ncbi:Bug family tripartite tricarboxylate transporter substrate binding protein [Glycomyces harbinensis]|uniref:Tripartite-type tricarboxylate transporter, receptor component TctC n=1 Tax=Glycomyces harbinensis TaxID=58114 RepID=A0A1G6XFP3_9ACTN|nr:tripartite tricarboxylate transporter substrate binding protein [Glycomyces harbinensis]SDD76026.1 Tripartite-type tricarboxylate transporter, receptor component TctC [Glycomyces harbinensis]
MNPRPFTRRGLLATTAAVPVAALTACNGVQGGADAAENDFPTRAVDFTVPFDAGGSSDLLSRAACLAAEEPLGQSIALTNKPGANGAVGLKELLSGDADGYSIALAVKSLFAITPLVVDDPDAVSIDDFRIIATLTNEAYVLVVHADSPYQSLEDLVAAPSLNYGTAGVGTGGQLSLALLFGLAGTEATDVPFDGGAPAVTALLGQEIDAVSGSLAETMPQIEAGALRPLTVFSEERSPFLADVPTAAESGYEVVVDQRRFVVAPGEVSDTVAGALVLAFEQARQDPDYQAFLQDNFMDVWEVEDIEARNHLSEAAQQYAQNVADAGLTLGDGS